MFYTVTEHRLFIYLFIYLLFTLGKPLSETLFSRGAQQLQWLKITFCTKTQEKYYRHKSENNKAEKQTEKLKISNIKTIMKLNQNPSIQVKI